MNKDAQEQLFDHLDNHFGTTPVREDGFGITGQEYIEYIFQSEGVKLDIRTSGARLNKMLDSGWKVQRMVDYDGRRRNVYWKD